MCPFPPPHDLHAQSPCVDQFRDVCDHHSSDPHNICSHRLSFGHDVNSCPYYDVFDECYAGLEGVWFIACDSH